MVHTIVKPTDQVWDNLKEYWGAPRNETFLSILESLRLAHPSHVVTVAPKDAGLLRYAKADEAKAEMESEGDRFAVVRKFHPGDRRAGVKSGEMKDDVRFAKYHYSWQGHDFIVYHTKAVINHVFGVDEELSFILYERSNLSTDETCPKPVDDLIASATKWNDDLHTEIYMYDREQWTKSKELWQSVQQAHWDDVVLEPKLKRSLINDVEGFFGNEAQYHEYAVAYRRGIILHGPPGNGKSLCIKALMHSLAKRPDPIPTLYVKSFHGCHQEWYNIREVFEKARAMSPCLLVFEDLDSMVTKKVRSFFLNEVDGLEDNHGLMIVGSTNYLEKLDPSITKRPSRFDRKYRFDLPSHEDRVRYAQFWRSKLSRNKKVAFPESLSQAFADQTEGFSFAYLKEVFITSLLLIVGAQREGLDVPEGLDEDDTGINGVEVHGNSGHVGEGLLGRVIGKQVKVLRNEMEEAEGAKDPLAKKGEIDGVSEKEDESDGEGGGCC